MYVTVRVSLADTVFALEKSPALNNVPVVLSITEEPAMLIKQPATVPLVKIANAYVPVDEIEPPEAAAKVTVLRGEVYVGALAAPTSNQEP